MKLEHSPKAKLYTQLIIESFRLNAHFTLMGDALIQDIDLSTARWQVLHIIEMNPLPVAQIARQLNITRQSVLRTVNTLQKQGFVTLRENPHHQRAKLVELLEEGKKRLGLARVRQITWANNEADSFDLQQLQQTVSLMQAVREATDKAEAYEPCHAEQC